VCVVKENQKSYIRVYWILQVFLSGSLKPKKGICLLLWKP
jgi:hypothetical protein